MRRSKKIRLATASAARNEIKRAIKLGGCGEGRDAVGRVELASSLMGGDEKAVKAARDAFKTACPVRRR